MQYRTSFSQEETNRCLLCHEAACSKACTRKIDPAGLLRSLRFDNPMGAAKRLIQTSGCADCSAPCEAACVHATYPIQIKSVLTALAEDYGKWEPLEEVPVDLSCSFLGVKLENPFLLSSSVVASTYEKMARAFEMGWAGACFKTLCNFIPKETSPRYAALTGEHDFHGFKNIEQLSCNSMEEDLEIIRRLKKDYPTKVIIASIMGRNSEEWEQLARLCQEAGADLIECNFSCPNMEQDGLGVDIGQSPEDVAKFTAAARKGCTIPLLAKTTPNVTDMRPIAIAAMRSGADGIATINTVKCLMGMNMDTYATEPSVRGKSGVGGYSGRAVKPIALRFVWELASCSELDDLPISGMGGIDTWRDAAEFILLGANHVQITTSVMQYGARIIDDLIDGLSWYLREKALGSVSELQGLAVRSVKSLDELDRQSILLPRFRRDKCVGCGRCYLSCRDGGHEAITMKDGKPIMFAAKCVGCHLCVLVCPSGAIEHYGKRI